MIVIMILEMNLMNLISPFSRGLMKGSESIFLFPKLKPLETPEDDCDDDPGDELDELDPTFVLRVGVSLPLPPKAEATVDT